MSLIFNRTYFVYFLAILLIEILIASFIETGFIRSVFGDYLVVILIYCFIKSFLNIRSLSVALFVLIFAFTIELLQMAGLIYIFDLQENPVAHLVLGSTFQIEDLVAYTLGITTVVLLERLRNKFR